MEMSGVQTPSPSPSGEPQKKKKHLGWAPPTLYIPPPDAQPYMHPHMQPQSAYSGNLSMNSGPNPHLPPHMYHRKASQFMFNQFNDIRDFTMSTAKSGLGIGEKSAFWLYNKLSSWSKRWFTHFFLTFVIVAYTVGGAIMFQTVEGRNEEKIVEIDIRVKRTQLVQELRNLSIVVPREKSDGEWHGAAVAKLHEFEDYVIEAYKNHQLIVSNHGPKIWTFWNAVVYCSTIYTTIASAMRASKNSFSLANMDSSATSNTENVDQRTAQTDNENVPSMEKLESMVTPEQVHSAAVARKRRTITRKRTNDLNKNRSQTPLRAQRDADDTSSEYEDDQLKSERRTRPKSRALSKERSQTPGKQTTEKQANEKVLPVTQVDKPEAKNEEKLDTPTGEILKKRQPLKLAEAPSDNETQDPVEEHKRHMQEEEREVVKEPEIIEYPPEVVLRRSRSTRKTTDSASTSDRQSITSESGRQERSSSIPRQLEEQIQKLDNFVTTNTQELMHFLHKAKTTVEEKGKELRRRKFKKTDDQKRSQSQPKQLTETDVLDSFRKAQKATAEREQKRLRSLSARRYSSASEKSPSPEPQRPLRKRVLVKDIIKEKQKTSTDDKKHPKLKDQIKCNKIVEVLDPHTSKVIAVKNVGEVAANMRVIDAIKIFKYYSPRQMFKEYRKYKVDMHEEYTRIRRMRRKCINHMIILLIFCGLGGIMFKFIEGHFENFYKCGVKRVKRDFIDLLWVKSHNMREEEWKSLARNRLRIFEEELHNAHEAGVHSYSGQRSWSFLNGIVYCLTVVTTIGYGHLYPTTKTGQALTIVYSLIGIPLFLIILTDFGKLFTRCIKFLWSFVRRLYYTGSCRKIRKTTHAQEIFKGAQMMYEIATFRRPSTIDPNMMPPPGASSPPDSIDGTTAPPTPAISNFEIDDEFNLPISLAILLLVLYIFLGAVLFGIWEGWDFFASFYFVFISMSTIGFGDYVPRHPIFMIVSIVYLVFGLALMSMCINVVQVKLSDTFNQASAKIGATIGLGVAAEDGSIKPVPPQPIEMPHVHGSIVDLDKISVSTLKRS